MRARWPLVGALAAATVLAACGGGAGAPSRGPTPSGSASASSAPLATPAQGTSRTEPVAPSASAPPAAPSAPAWRVGATPLPLRPDGFGQVLPTPPELVDRRLPTVDVLPPPADGAYAATVAPIDASVRTRMGETWQEGCPVPLEDLRYLTVGFWGFDDRPHTGELVVHREAADGITRVFGELFAARFPIEQMRLLTTADLTAPPTGDGKVTAAFVCRATRQSTVWSAHASGLAIDVNPFHNPYERDGLVLPELASSYLDRTNVRPGMVVGGDVVDRTFAAIGWSWGGRFRSLVDYQHFSATGR